MRSPIVHPRQFQKIGSKVEGLRCLGPAAGQLVASSVIRACVERGG